MLAFASPEAVKRTLETGRATFYSRSRGGLWEKGQTSGNGMEVSAVIVDCDADALIYQVTPRGPTCHTGAETCFYRRLDGGDVPAATTLLRLEATIASRKQSNAEKSYVKSLFDAGAPKIGEKLREEADELARAVASEDAVRVASEAADVVFHVMVALRSRDVSFDAVLRELDRRSGTSGHEEKAARSPGS